MINEIAKHFMSVKIYIFVTFYYDIKIITYTLING